MKYKFLWNNKLGRKQAIVHSGNTTIAVLETFGIENRIEEFKKHIERVIHSYVNCMGAIETMEIKSYNPKKIDGFEYSINKAGTVALLRYKGIVFAQLNVKDISCSMDVTLRYIYKVAQSYTRYMGNGAKKTYKNT